MGIQSNEAWEEAFEEVPQTLEEKNEKLNSIKIKFKLII